MLMGSFVVRRSLFLVCGYSLSQSDESIIHVDCHSSFIVRRLSFFVHRYSFSQYDESIIHVDGILCRSSFIVRSSLFVVIVYLNLMRALSMFIVVLH